MNEVANVGEEDEEGMWVRGGAERASGRMGRGDMRQQLQVLLVPGCNLTGNEQDAAVRQGCLH